MLGQKVIVNSPRLARLGLGNGAFSGGIRGLASPVLVTSADPKNQNKQARVWSEGILSASFKTSSTPDAPLANVKYIQEEEEPFDILTDDLAAGEHEFDPGRSRELSQTVEYHQNASPNIDIDQTVPISLDIQRNDTIDDLKSSSHLDLPATEQVESYDCKGSISLHSVMQSMVPNPFQPTSTAPTHVNMPGGGHQMTLKYLNDRELDTHQSRHHSTSAFYRRQLARKFSTSSIINASGGRAVELQGVQGDIEYLQEILSGPSAQGIQGDDCARFAIWLKNCGKFGDCTEQLEAVKTGRKTLQQIFDEQDEQIRKAAEKFQMSSPDQSRH